MGTESLDLKGKVALVTGASKGIGAAIARIYAEQGASVRLSSRKIEALEETASTIDGETAVYVANAGDPEQARACVAATMPPIKPEFCGTRVIAASPSIMFCVSSTLNNACEMALSSDIFWSAWPTICGRIAAAFANSMAAWRSAVLVMMFTWFVPSWRMALVTCRRRLTTFSSICRIIARSRKCTLRM